MRKFVILPLVLFFCLTACERQPQVQTSGKTIKVGVIVPFFEQKLSQGAMGLMGFTTAAKMHPFLSNGDAIEMLIEDDQDNPRKTIKVLKKLVEEDKVAAVLMMSSSNAVLAISTSTERYKTPILAIIASHPKITRNNDYITSLIFDDAFQGAITALFVRDELLMDRVAVFSNPDNESSKYLAQTFAVKFKNTGGEITDTIQLTKHNDYINILKTIKEKDPDLLYLPIAPRQVLKIHSALRQLQWNPKIIGSDGLIANLIMLLDNDLRSVNGMLAVDFFSDDMPLTDYGKNAYQIYQTLYQDFPATTYATLAFEGYTMLLQAMNRCPDSSDRQCVNSKLRETEDFVGITGKISILSSGKARRPLIVTKIENNEVNYVVKVY